MTDKQLELIDIITSKYRGNILAAVRSCIDTADTPINVRCFRMKAAACNQSYLDFMRRTYNGFLTAPLKESFSPDNRANGMAKVWMGTGLGMIKRGGGNLPLTMWNGIDELNVNTECRVIKGWLVTAFIPHAKPQVSPPVQYPVSPQTVHKLRTDSRIVVPFVR